ncbi:MAG TPA: cupin domain-containing protein [Bacillota bacterium]
MQEELKQIADRIRGLREIKAVEPDTIARELGITSAEYETYESGETDIPVGILYKLAQYYHVELATFLTGEEPRLHLYSLTRNGKGVSVERRRDYKYQSLAANFVHKKAEPFLVTVEPGPETAPIHYNSHPGQEFDYCLEGTLQVMLNGHAVVLNEGDSLFYDSGVAHGMKALNGKNARFLAVIL